MTFAADVQAALKAALPTTWKVDGYVPIGARVDRLTVGVWTTEITHGEGALAGAYVVGYTVTLYTPHQDPAKADAALDPALEQLLEALWTIPDVVLDKGERQVSNDQTTHVWSLTVRQGITITSTPEA